MKNVLRSLRACFKISRRPAARDFARGQGGEFRASPQRAVRNEPTPATDKRPAARRVFAAKAGLHQAPGFLPRLHRMEERAGERRGVFIGRIWFDLVGCDRTWSDHLD